MSTRQFPSPSAGLPQVGCPKFLRQAPESRISTNPSALKSPGITMVTVVSAQVRLPAALLGTHARLCAALGVVAVGLTWKFSTNGEVVLVQVTWRMKLGAVVEVGAPQPVPF